MLLGYRCFLHVFFMLTNVVNYLCWPWQGGLNKMLLLNRLPIVNCYFFKAESFHVFPEQHFFQKFSWSSTNKNL